jgi:hypothetical protein
MSRHINDKGASPHQASLQFNLMLIVDFPVLKAVPAPLQTLRSHETGYWQEKTMSHTKEVFLDYKMQLSYRSKQLSI